MTIKDHAEAIIRLNENEKLAYKDTIKDLVRTSRRAKENINTVLKTAQLSPDNKIKLTNAEYDLTIAIGQAKGDLE